MLPSREQLLAKAEALPERPVAIEAYWDGDSGGWFVCLIAVLKTKAGYREGHLSAIRGGSDLRIFNGQVPPWGEALLAQELGEQLAAKLEIPFYFPSPNHPEDDCPRWWEQDQGNPCRRCGILLLQKHDCPWRGACYFCHLGEVRENKESKWTPEEREGPRCCVCGDPANGTMSGDPMCLDCLRKYEYHQCSHCGVTSRILKTEGHSDICSLCDLRTRLNAVPVEQRQIIRAIRITDGEGAAIHTARRLLGWGLYDSLEAVREFSK